VGRDSIPRRVTLLPTLNAAFGEQYGSGRREPNENPVLHGVLCSHDGPGAMSVNLSMATTPRGVQWAAMLVVSGVFVPILLACGLPAAFLLGPMLAAILVAAAEGAVRVPSGLFAVAQGVIGLLIARVLKLSLLHEVLRDWPVFAVGVLSVLFISTALGVLMTRWQVLPGTTALWGTSPGAATAMVLMAESFGADMRLVAVMQYLRVTCVTVVASVVSRFWTVHAGQSVPIIWFAAVDLRSLVGETALIAVCVPLALRLKIPAGPLLVPMVAGVVVQDAGWLQIQLPEPLLVGCYALVGWSIGLRFTRPILRYALRSLPQVLGAILVLIAACGGLAVLMVRYAHVSALTAYLATSPGGADSVAIIASSAHVDMAFVMAMQTLRFLVVLVTGPPLARFLARRTGARRS